MLITGPPERSSHASDGRVGSLRAEALSVSALAGLLVRGRFSRADRTIVRRRVRRHRQFWIDAARALDLPSRLVGDTGLEITLNHGAPGERHTIEVSDSGNSLSAALQLGESDDAALVYDLLAEAGVPVVKYRPFTIATLSAAARFLDGAPGSCVVRPVEETFTGHGATADVVDARTLRIAAAAAAAGTIARELRGGRNRSRSRSGRLRAGLRDLSSVPLIIRHQLQGDDYRLLFLDGELIDAVQRIAPTTASGDVYRPARHLMSPSAVELGVRAAAAVGGRLIGLDIVVDDGLDHAGGRVLDVDRIPRLQFHYNGIPGAVDVARLVLERLAQV